MLVFVAAAEAILRRTVGSNNQENYVYRSGYYSYPPLTVQRFYNKEDRCDISVGVDEFGFRNTAGSLASSRIALLGDSFISAV
ncbi:MAG TPA: hypothetical protein PLP56_07735, partial [Candidatus Omnitrophota bacterium]|nr:hypothetical protein [Candidatus Omnitrophota bacterium]